MHFTKARTKHNSACPLILPTSTIHLSPHARVLGVIFNMKLSWQPHLQHIQSKLATQTNILSRLTAWTWGTFLQVLRLLYTAIVCPAITTGCPAWWAPPSTPFHFKGLGDNLQRVKNHCLRIFSRAYKATPVQNLQAEVSVPPLPLHIDGRQAQFRLKSAKSEIDRDWGGHIEEQTVSQLHQNTLQMPHNTQKPIDCQQPSPLYTSCGSFSPPCHLPAILGPTMGSSGRLQMPCHHFNKGKLQNQCPLAAAVAVFSQKPSQP
jgi:hypothetical protein